MIAGSHPILSCEEARDFERQLFGGNEAREWGAMQRAGQAIAAAVLRDSQEIGGLRADGRILVLVGKGHNGGDALIAAAALLAELPGAVAEMVFVFGGRLLRPLASRAWQMLAQRFSGRVSVIATRDLQPSYDLLLDGVFGFQFRPPLDESVRSLSEAVNALHIRFRAAVDLPSGGAFQADFTYATGAVKRPALEGTMPGRVRYLDLDFFTLDSPGNQRVLIPAILAPLAGFRSPQSDKRSQGHLFVVAGSMSFPGAVVMTVLAALRSGVGLVTAFVPEALVPAFAAQVPEAIWVGWPTTPRGGLALEGLHLYRERMERADACVIGPGIGREPETLALIAELVKHPALPVLLDADALQHEIIRGAKSRLILTPHAGEYARIAGTATIEDFAANTGAVVILKGPVTRIAGGGSAAPEKNDSKPGSGVVYHSLFGGPVLARGGSGDLLAGIVGSLLAQAPEDRLLAAARGTVWHGLAAEALARKFGQVAVKTTQLVDCLPEALREPS
jgi:NAD(P)H-hydrate epimerase